ncbi:5985_t:CDS:1, partial [Scutellospora calospora]
DWWHSLTVVSDVSHEAHEGDFEFDNRGGHHVETRRDQPVAQCAQEACRHRADMIVHAYEEGRGHSCKNSKSRHEDDSKFQWKKSKFQG